MMNISHEDHIELIDCIEDTVSYYCDQYQKSGEVVWKIVEALSVAKQAEIAGLLAPTFHKL